jgi:hypothetical protein
MDVRPHRRDKLTRMAIQRPVPYEELLYIDALKMTDPPDEAEVRRLRERALAGDPEAAFRVGLALVRREPSLEPDEAAPWFERAIELGGSVWAWLATEAYDQDPHLYRAAIARAITTDYPRPDAPGIQVAPDTIGPLDDDDWHMSPVAASFQVRNTSDAVQRALARATDRLGLVDERGREYASDEEFDQIVNAPDGPRRPDGDLLFTVEWTGLEDDDPDGGPYILTSVPDLVSGPMMRTMIRIVVDELIDAGITQAHLGPYRHITHHRGDPYPPLPPGPEDSPGS